MRIAIVKLSALGDIIQAMVVLQFIKEFNKEILIDWVVEERFKELLNFHPHVNKVHVINLTNVKKNKSIISLFKEFKKLRYLESYDLVIDMQGLFKSAIISKLIPSDNTFGFDKFSIRERIASVFYDKTHNCSYKSNIIERNISLVNFALEIEVSKEQIKNKIPILNSKQEDFKFNWSNNKKNILIIPGASNISKCYPAVKFSELTTLIDANFLVCWGNDEEKKIAIEIKNQSDNINVCEKLSLGSLISLIKKVDLVIGSDTGPTHMAWALNKPSITLFGATPGYRNTFSTTINQIIESNSKVNPEKIDKNDFSIREIEVDEILKLAKILLK
jgi:heptosyltransferase I